MAGRDVMVGGRRCVMRTNQSSGGGGSGERRWGYGGGREREPRSSGVWKVGLLEGPGTLEDSVSVCVEGVNGGRGGVPR